VRADYACAQSALVNHHQSENRSGEKGPVGYCRIHVITVVSRDDEFVELDGR